MARCATLIPEGHDQTWRRCPNAAMTTGYARLSDALLFEVPLCPAHGEWWELERSNEPFTIAMDA